MLHQKKLFFLVFLSLFISLSFVSALTCPSGTTTPYCSTLNPHGYQKCVNGVTLSYTCSNYNDVCKEGVGCASPAVTCPTGTTTPYCSTLNPHGYQKCVNGVTLSYTCSNYIDVCKEGVGCASPASKTLLRTSAPYCSVINEHTVQQNFFYSDGSVKTTTTDCGVPSVYICKDGRCIDKRYDSTYSSDVPYRNTADCPSGTTTPYCSTITNDFYFQCVSGVTKQLPCNAGYKCTDGEKCYSVNLVTDLLNKVGDATGQSIGAVTAGLFQGWLNSFKQYSTFVSLIILAVLILLFGGPILRLLKRIPIVGRIIP